MDQTAAALNDMWPTDEGVIRERASVCVAAIDTTLGIFGDRAFATFIGGKFERRFNRAVFDVMTTYFKQQVIAQAAEQRTDEVVEAFKNLCSDDADFLRSVQTTTKSVDATRTRLERWADALSHALDLAVVAPPVGH